MHSYTFQPQLIAPSSWLAPTATILGDVRIGDLSSIWFGAVIRGDVARIQIGCRTNIQDLCCLHADEGVPCTIGDGVTVGHGAIIHGATIESDVLIGMRATVLNGARVGTNSIVAAGALVPEGKVIPPNSLVMGTPAKVVRQLTADDTQRILKGAEHYVAASRAYMQTLPDA
ncbi:MAG: gamma carbonic anhydrase family protein [Planctomycetales bacterium]|nr:gamma carbonic anhydrase family protein [Planctomycetales bacterium]